MTYRCRHIASNPAGAMATVGLRLGPADSESSRTEDSTSMGAIRQGSHGCVVESNVSAGVIIQMTATSDTIRTLALPTLAGDLTKGRV